MKRKKLFGLFGAGGHGRESIFHTHNLKDFEILFIDDKSKIDKIGKYKVIGLKEFFSLKGYLKYFNISLSDVKKRHVISEKFINENCKPLSLIAKNSIICENKGIEEGSIISSYAYIGPNVKTGKFFQMNARAHVHHDCNIGNYVTISPGAICNGNINIEDRVFIGAGALLKNGSNEKPLNIGKNSIIGMGSIIIKDVPDNSLVYGNPMKIKKINNL